MSIPASPCASRAGRQTESAPLLNLLYHEISREAFVFRLVWREGTLAIWDNRTTWHKAENDYQGERRLMHRITLAGEQLETPDGRPVDPKPRTPRHGVKLHPTQFRSRRVFPFGSRVFARPVRTVTGAWRRADARSVNPPAPARSGANRRRARRLRRARQRRAVAGSAGASPLASAHAGRADGRGCAPPARRRRDRRDGAGAADRRRRPARSRRCSISTMRSASAIASPTSCVTRIAVKRSFNQTRSSRRCISMRVSASSAPSGSSSASRRGRLTSARASATRCFWPPDSTDGHSPARSASPTASSASSARARASRLAALGAETDLDIGEHARPGQQPRLLKHHARDLGARRDARRTRCGRRPARRARRSTAAACSCRSRCGRRWRGTGRREHADRARCSTRVAPKLLARPRAVSEAPRRRFDARARRRPMRIRRDRHGHQRHAFL